ncbi:hypothetical protein LZ554_007499 [Drepanopeziza brunnea f. sp. 'monogermtubi']|nr:hypothetical protein LZ554_007499 [Drepanopeziza brunnea f. sp. 'monogermtubi']
MPSKFQVVEPHPHVSKYTYTGRGGAGNTVKVPKTTVGASARGPASLFENGLPASKSNFSSGRGGAGNIHKPSERCVFSFDEELVLQQTRDDRAKAGESHHIGRGGAGNWTSSRLDHHHHQHHQSSRKDSSSSMSSNGSIRSGFFGRLSLHSERR